jgi:hypothetical protein
MGWRSVLVLVMEIIVRIICFEKHACQKRREGREKVRVVDARGSGEEEIVLMMTAQSRSYASSRGQRRLAIIILQRVDAKGTQGTGMSAGGSGRTARLSACTSTR